MENFRYLELKGKSPNEQTTFQLKHDLIVLCAVAMNVTYAAHSCYNAEIQSLHCQFCKGFVNLSRRTVTNPERIVMLIEAFEEQHKHCKEFEDVGRAEQVWKRGMKLLLVN